MIKNLKAYKKNFTLATMVLMAVAMTGCAKKEETPEQTVELYTEDHSTYYSTYDENDQEFVWEEIPEDEAKNINKDVVAADEVDENGDRYIATAEAYGYVAASKNETKQEAIQNNPGFQDNALFLSGFEQGKKDKYQQKAMDESRQYVALSKHQIPTSMMEETYYYPLEELQVVSYIGENAIVWNTEEEQIKTGDYQDVLGKDMSSYIGQDYKVETLQQFATEYMHEITDGVYLSSGNPARIPEVAGDTFIKQNSFTTRKAK